MNCSERRASPPFLAMIATGSCSSHSDSATPAARAHGRLTTDGTLKLAPVFISNGDEIVFATHEVPNLVVDRSPQVERRLAAPTAPDGRQPSVRPGLLARRALSRICADRRLHLRWCW